MKSNNCYFSFDEDNKSFGPNYTSILDYHLIPPYESLEFCSQFNKVDEESENSNNNQLFNNLYNIEIPDKINPIEKESIGASTNANTSLIIFTFENIKNQLNEVNDPFNEYKIIIDNSIEAPEIKEIEYEMKSLQRKRKEYGKKVDTNISKHLRGRKKAVDISERVHNKKSPDNIMKKIKRYFIEYLIIFVNAIIKEKEDRLKMLDHKKYIDKLKREEDLNLLKMTVKDFLSRDISPKYIKSNSDYNKIKINKILNEQKDNEVIKFVFNMTIKDWIDLFTLKKTIYEFENIENLTYSEYDKIQSNIPLINEILDENKDDEIYFTKFIFYLYNYENWFLIRKGRNREKKI